MKQNGDPDDMLDWFQRKLDKRDSSNWTLFTWAKAREKAEPDEKAKSIWKSIIARMTDLGMTGEDEDI